MITPRQLDVIEQTYTGHTSFEKVILRLTREVRKLRSICLRVVEANDEEADGNALMELGCIARQIQTEILGDLE